MNVDRINTNINCEELVIPAAGPIAAILYHRIRYWCREHAKRGNKKKYHEDGHWWQWDSYTSMMEVYPYFSKMQIRRALQKLKDIGIIKVKKTKNFKSSQKYAAIEVGDWMMSEKFNDLPKSVRNKISDVLRRREVLPVVVCRGVENNIRGVENDTLGVKNDTPIYLIDKLIRNLEKGEAQNSEDDASNLDLIKAYMEQLKISNSQVRILLNHFADHVKNLRTKTKDTMKIVNQIYRTDSSGCSYPFWIRLLYGEEQGFINSDIRDVVAPRVNLEIKTNPYIMVILDQKLRNYNWAELDIEPEEHIAKWNKINNKVEFILEKAEQC